MPTTVTYTIDTGGTGDYTSLSAWEAAQQQNLVTNDRLMQVRVKASGGTADTTACDINGWTTDSTRYIDIAPATGQEHAGVWNTGIYRMSVASGGWALINRQNYTRTRGIQAEYSGVSGVTFYLFSTTLSLDGCLIERCIGRYTGSVGTGIAVQRSSGAGTVLIRNNLLIDTGGDMRGVSAGDGATFAGTANADNNTLIRTTGTGARQGLYQNTGTLVARNNIVQGFQEAYNGTFAAGTDYNATNLNETPGTGSNNLVSQTFSFVDSGAGNYRLTAALAGVDLSGTFTDDIIGTVRPQGAEFDIGCFEKLAAGSPWYAIAQM